MKNLLSVVFASVLIVGCVEVVPPTVGSHVGEWHGECEKHEGENKVEEISIDMLGTYLKSYSVYEDDDCSSYVRSDIIEERFILSTENVTMEYASGGYSSRVVIMRMEDGDDIFNILTQSYKTDGSLGSHEMDIYEETDGKLGLFQASYLKSYGSE